MVFRIYGLVCAGMLVLFTLVNFYNMKEGGFSTELGEDIDPRNVSSLQSRDHQVNLLFPGDGVRAPRPSRRPRGIQADGSEPEKLHGGASAGSRDPAQPHGWPRWESGERDTQTHLHICTNSQYSTSWIKHKILIQANLNSLSVF